MSKTAKGLVQERIAHLKMQIQYDTRDIKNYESQRISLSESIMYTRQRIEKQNKEIKDLSLSLKRL